MVENISDLAGLSRSHPMLALAMLIFMFSLAGIPPLAGFFGKLYVFMAAVDAGLFWPAVLGVLASVVACLLLPAHRQGDVLRRAAPRRSTPTLLRHEPRRGVRAALLVALFSSAAAAARADRGRRRQRPVPVTDRDRPAGRLVAGRAAKRRQHQRRSRAPGRGRRARRHRRLGARADRRPRPPRPDLGVAGRQSLQPRRSCGPTARRRGRRELGFVAALAVAGHACRPAATCG